MFTSKEDYSGLYYQIKDGKVFKVTQISSNNAFNDCKLTPINFEGKSKDCAVHLMELWLRRGMIKPYNPLQPNFQVKKLKFNPIGSLLRDMVGGYRSVENLDEFEF